MIKRTKKQSSYELYKTIRKDWGDIHPATKIAKDKTKYSRKEKHKPKFDY